jgi:hypothetical protein
MTTTPHPTETSHDELWHSRSHPPLLRVGYPDERGGAALGIWPSDWRRCTVAGRLDYSHPVSVFPGGKPPQFLEPMTVDEFMALCARILPDGVVLDRNAGFVDEHGKLRPGLGYPRVPRGPRRFAGCGDPT